MGRSILDGKIRGSTVRTHSYEQVESLPENTVFVFGSNEAGRHGAGAARAALLLFGAVYGVGVGMQGQSYAIPTKDMNIQPLPLASIEKYIGDFLHFARHVPELDFLLTKIGCGLAGFTVEEIAGLFKGKFIPNNVIVPKDFVPHM